MAELRRGFKTEAHAHAREVRAELGLDADAPLDPWRLAAHLEIPILRLVELRHVAAAEVRYLRSVESGAFSAATIFRGRARVIVHNDGHAPTRQASDIAHELAHALLCHAPRPALDILGCRDWDDEVEKEADWLGPALLVSEEAAVEIVRRGLALDAAALEYGVSVKLLRFRINVTGAQRRVAFSPRRRSLTVNPVTGSRSARPR